MSDDLDRLRESITKAGREDVFQEWARADIVTGLELAGYIESTRRYAERAIEKLNNARDRLALDGITYEGVPEQPDGSMRRPELSYPFEKAYAALQELEWGVRMLKRGLDELEANRG